MMPTRSPIPPLMPSQTIESLTALRFIAAAMILIHHVSGRFGLPDFAYGLALGQGVSFFFVLSGFILTWVYGRGTRPTYGTFLHHRFFRVYPLHLLTLVAAILLIDTARNEFTEQPWTALLQLGLMQSWPGDVATAMTFNGPAWSISTEFGFYLLFPLLLALGNRIWIGFLGVAAATFAVMAFAVTHPYIDASARIWDAFHVQPLGRLIEFTFGMLLGRAVIEGRFSRLRPSAVAFTLYEILAVAAVSIFIFFPASISHAVHGLIPSRDLVAWLNRGGGFAAFGLLILIFSFERGVLSRVLRHRAMVFLGEASFALYLIHQLVIRYLMENDGLVAWMSPSAVLVVVTVSSLALASLSFLLVETPIRIAARKGPGSGLDRLRLAVQSAVLKTTVASILVIAVTLLASSLVGIRTVSEGFAQALRGESIAIDQGYLDKDIKLLSVRVSEDDRDYCYTLLWYVKTGHEVNGVQRALHLVSADGAITGIGHRTLVSGSARPRQGWSYVRDDHCLRRGKLSAAGEGAKLRILLIDEVTQRPIRRLTSQPSPKNLYVELSPLTARPAAREAR